MGKRFIADIPTSYSVEEVNALLQNFTQAEGFSYEEYKGEMVYKKGEGIITAPQFIKVLIAEGTVHIEAWLKYALLPGVFYGELGLDGFIMAVPKSLLRSRVDKLISSITYTVAQQPVEIPQNISAAE